MHVTLMKWPVLYNLTASNLVATAMKPCSAPREGVWGTAPCVSTLCLPDITTHDQISQASPLHICTLQVIKDWS